MNRIKELRNERNWSLEEIGEKLNVNYSFISRTELGKQSIKDVMIEPLCNLLEVEIAYLLGFSELGIKCKTLINENYIDFTINKKEYQKYSKCIYINSNGNRILTNTGYESILFDRAVENGKIIFDSIPPLIDVDDTSKKIIKALIKMNTNQKEVLSLIIDTWGIEE